MGGKRVFSKVEHRPDPSRFLAPVWLASNAALYGTARAITPTTEIVFREPFLDPRESDRPIIYVTWHRLNYVATPMFLSLPPDARPTIISHDGGASRAFSHHSVTWLGMDVFVFRRRAKVAPREQIAEYVRSTGRPILNLPDSGGPYGKVKPGILEVARACNARIVPFQVEATRALTVGRTLGHRIPLPFGRIHVRRGPALDGSATAQDLQQALDGLD